MTRGVAIVPMLIAAGASAGVVDFTEVPPGTEIDGVTIVNMAFTYDFRGASATVEVEGVPEPSAYGEPPVLLGDVDALLRIDFIRPVDGISYTYVVNDTVMSSTHSRVDAYDADGTLLGVAQGFVEAQLIWPGLADTAGGDVALDGVGAISYVEITFPFTVFATVFALDNFCYHLPGDVNGDEIIDVSDLIEVITAWGACPAPPDPCPADLDGDGAVGVGDLVQVILNWG